MKQVYQKYFQEKPDFDKKTTLGIFCLVVVIAGVFGFLYEYIFYYFNGGMQQFYWRGGNFLPWINIYAYGALGIIFFTFRYRKKPLRVFFLSLLICGGLELISGYVMYTFLMDGVVGTIIRKSLILVILEDLFAFVVLLFLESLVCYLCILFYHFVFS